MMHMRRISLVSWLLALLCLPMTGMTSTGMKLDRAPDKARDVAALQRGAKIFVNYCLNCHSANYMRYNRLRDLGLTEQQIKDNLLFTADKVGEPMTIAMRSQEAKEWFGAPPPDLTVIARAKASAAGSGADWLYTYLRTFYRDDSRPTGWNNLVFDRVSMPHVMWELQGEYGLRLVEKIDVHGEKVQLKKLEMLKPGKLPPDEYDALMADLVGYLVYMSEPIAETRKQIGMGVLAALALLFALTYLLKREYWKDVH